MFDVPWPVVGSLGTGVANLYLLRYVWKYREKPGGRWFLVVVACQVAMCLFYGVGLLVFDPLGRVLLHMPFLVALNWIGVCYLGFALEYTGRGHLVRASAFRLVVALAVGITFLVVTNPLHEFIWSDFRIDPVFGAATVSYAHNAGFFLTYATALGLAGVGILVLVDTVVSYGPLYRMQAVAIALTPLPPVLVSTLWVFRLGPVPQLNLVPLMFLPHMALDLYALFREDMFELNPATRRTGERAAIEDLGNPVVITDEKLRIVTLNAAARDTFGVDKRSALTRRLDRLLADDIDPEADEQLVAVRDDGRRLEFKVTPSPLRDAADTHVGYTVVLQDITDERQREQRLQVLNRVLRHNLRNDMTVVDGYVEAAAERVDDDAVADMLATAGDVTEGLIELGEKARQIEEALDNQRQREVVAVADLAASVAGDLREHHEGHVEVAVSPELRLWSNPRVLRVVFRSLLDNALRHDDGDGDGDGDGPTVELRLVDTDETGETAVFEVEDTGPGIPDYELSVIENGEETALDHGSGLGLWLVNWGVTSLGGDVSFDTDGGGTTVTLRLPGLLTDSGADGRDGGGYDGERSTTAS